MPSNDHDMSKAKSQTPPHHSTDKNSKILFTSERTNTDYFTLPGVCKCTGATEDELAVFVLKELIENGLDFVDLHTPPSYMEDPEIFVDVKYNQ
jgi:hypothetical protein